MQEGVCVLPEAVARARISTALAPAREGTSLMSDTKRREQADLPSLIEAGSDDLPRHDRCRFKSVFKVEDSPDLCNTMPIGLQRRSARA